MTHPPGYRFRAPTKDDLDGVTAVLAADQLASGGDVTLGSDFVSNRWSRSDFDMARDAWVVVDDAGRVVGYGLATRDEPSEVGSWGTVHPDHRGRGLGSALLDRIEERAEELLRGQPEARFRHAINAGDRAAQAMLRARGLQPLRHFWHMRLDLGESTEAGQPPSGIEIAGVHAPADLPLVHAVLEEAFAEDASHHPEPFEAWLEENTANPGFDATLWFLAKDRGEPVGTLTGSIQKAVGWVDYLGVLKRARGRRIGEALLRRAFATFAERGVRTVLLSVDAENPTGATALYERVGMRVVWGWDLWQRSLAQRSAPNGRRTAASASTAASTRSSTRRP